MLAWLAVCGGLVLALSTTAIIPGWILGVVVAAALVLAVALGVQRYRVERNLARMVWRALTTRSDSSMPERRS
jgi:hypothetical protein